MRRTKLGGGVPSVEAMVGLLLGAVGGCMLGALEGPLDAILFNLTLPVPLKPLVEEVTTVGALGLGTLIGATALSAAMTSAVAGVILAAIVALVFVGSRSCLPPRSASPGLLVSIGLAGALGITVSGATLGLIIQWVVKTYGMVGLLWALSLFTALKPALHLVFKLMWGDRACCTLGTTTWSEEGTHDEDEQRQRDVSIMEHRILSLEKGGGSRAAELQSEWAAERRQREDRERRKRESEEAAMEQKTIQDWINTVLVKHVDFLAFSGIPMTVVALVTSGFGMFGYGSHQVVFLALLAMVAVMAYLLIKSSDFKFWMLIGCMGMIATSVIAMLTLHAGQVVVTNAIKLKALGQDQPRENISARMNQRSSVEALNAAVFVARLCQLSLGATVGGALVRRAVGELRVIIGAASLAGVLLGTVELLGPILGEGGTAGAFLGVVGAAGVSVGGVAAMTVGWSSWFGTIGTVTGLLLGALGVGQWHLVNIGLQVPTAYVFAMTNPF